MYQKPTDLDEIHSEAVGWFTRGCLTMRRDKATDHLSQLPDEILLTIITHLRILQQDDMRTMKALGLTCRRLRDLTNDYHAIQSMLSDQQLKSISLSFDVTWTPRTLWRFSKAMFIGSDCAMKVWNIWKDANRFSQLPVRHNVTLMTGIFCFVCMDGLEDNAPSYEKLPSYPDDGLLSMLVSAFLFQEAFLSRYFVVIPNFPNRATLSYVRKALRYVFLTQGPLLAARMLENTETQYPCYRSLTETRRALMKPSQKLIVTDCRQFGDPELPVTWTLENAIAQIMRRRPRSRYLPDYVDSFVEKSLSAVQESWRTTGYSTQYFDKRCVLPSSDRGGAELHEDLLNCLRLWRSGCHLW